MRLVACALLACKGRTSVISAHIDVPVVCCVALKAILALIPKVLV